MTRSWLLQSPPAEPPHSASTVSGLFLALARPVILTFTSEEFFLTTSLFPRRRPPPLAGISMLTLVKPPLESTRVSGGCSFTANVNEPSGGWLLWQRCGKTEFNR